MSTVNTNVAISSEVAQELIEHIRHRTTDLAESELRIPAEHFASPAHAAAEVTLMKRLPLVVAHVCEVKAAADFITRTVLGVPLLIVRQADGSVAAFRNMCRHRGGIVERAESGNKRAFMCQYHGWTYAAEGGGLRPVVYEETFGPIDYACSGLARFKTEVRHGLIFVTFDPDETSQSVADYLGPHIDAQIEPWNLGNAVLFLDKSFVKSMNWKLVMDGAIDSLHAQFLHPKPGGVGSRTVNNTAVFRSYGRHGKMFMPRAKLKTLVQSGESLEFSSKYVGSVMLLYPNSLYIDAPDHVEFWTVWPSLRDPGECTVKIRFFVRPEILSPEMKARINKSWAILEDAALEEDFPMELAIQQNAQACPGAAFLYGRNEKSAQHLHRQLRKDLA
jgi:phenylpropionate dioxygenase-like ring-hydroxylating dioxygenase large terminal subunit